MNQFGIFRAIATGMALARAQGRSVLIYTALSVVLPFMLFSFYPDADFRHLVVLVTQSGVIIAPGTIQTIIGLFAIAVFLFGTMLFAGWSALLNPSRDDAIVEVMMAGVSALLSLIVAVVIYLAVNIPSYVVAFTMVRSLTDPASVQGALPFIRGVSFFLLALLVWLSARLGLAGPVMAARASINPFAGLAESWRRTGSHQWRITLTIGLVQLVVLVVMSVALGALGALVLATYEGTPYDYLIALIWAVLLALTYLAFLILPAGLHATLTERFNESVFD
jgi:hypothetical protein